MDDPYLKRLFERMKLISQVPPGHKINFRTRSYSKCGTWRSALERFVHGESREELEREVTETVAEAKRALVAYRDKDVWPMHCRRMAEMIGGLHNLANTYRQNTPLTPTTGGTLQDAIELIQIELHRAGCTAPPSLSPERHD